jgi:hypothetical protein
MNKKRRERLREALDIIIECREEEEAAYDALPESIQGGERGDKMQEIIDSLTEMESTLGDIVEDV